MLPKLSSTLATSLSKTFDQRLKLYSVTAAAAGVSILALAQPSNAEVVITRKTIPLNQVNDVPILVAVDINRDGIPDFSFSVTNFAYHSREAKIAIVPLDGGAVVGGSLSGLFEVSPLLRGAKIGPSAHFSSKGFAQVQRTYIPYTPSTYIRKTYGEWGGLPNRYVGIKFLIQGKTHYGWIRLSINGTHYPVSGTVTAYAYETVANKPIFAGGIGPAPAAAAEGKTSSAKGPSLGMLAAGAGAMPVWRHAN